MIYFPSSHMIEQIRHGEFGQLRSIVNDYNVRSLDFSNKAIDGPLGKLIVKAVQGLDVTCLNFSHNNIGPQGALSLVESLKGLNLIEIDLSRNALGAAVMDVIKALAASSVKVVKLAYNQIGYQGLQDLKPVIMRSNLEVDLSHNIGAPAELI